jgi:hypothetical protein
MELGIASAANPARTRWLMFERKGICRANSAGQYSVSACASRNKGGHGVTIRQELTKSRQRQSNTANFSAADWPVIEHNRRESAGSFIRLGKTANKGADQQSKNQSAITRGVCTWAVQQIDP